MSPSRTLRTKFRDETFALLTDGGEIATLEERFDREQAGREQCRLRRECDRIQLEEALGFDEDLIERLAR